MSSDKNDSFLRQTHYYKPRLGCSRPLDNTDYSYRLIDDFRSYSVLNHVQEQRDRVPILLTLRKDSLLWNVWLH